MWRRPTLAALVCLLSTGCGDETPSPPSTGGSTAEVQLTGGERLGWSQQAGSSADLSAFRYAIYLDGVRSELLGASCGGVAGAAGYDCSALLPQIPAGTHTIELTTFVIDGDTYESAKSAVLRVIKAGLTSLRVSTAEQVRLNLQLVTHGLSSPSDLAFTPDGAIFVAERGGVVRVIRDGVLSPQPALDLSSEIPMPEGGLLGIALDQKFEQTQIIYVLYASGPSPRDLGFQLARFRSVNDTFGERAVLLDRIPASSRGASGALRLGADGKLYVALDDADRRWGSAILRLNLDATTPSDQAGATPVFSIDHQLPKAFDWQASSGELWVVEGLGSARGRLSAVTTEKAAEKRAVVRVRYELPEGIGAASATFYRGALVPVFRDNLFIAAETGRHLLRLRFDPRDPERIVTTERLLQDDIGGLRVVAAGPDGALYLGNDTALWRLAP